MCLPAEGPRHSGGTDQAELAFDGFVARRGVRNADGVEIEEVASLADEEVDDLVGGSSGGRGTLVGMGFVLAQTTLLRRIQPS